MFPVSFWHHLSWWLVPYSFPECISWPYPSSLSPWRWVSAMEGMTCPHYVTLYNTHHYSFAASVLFIVPQRGKDQGLPLQQPMTMLGPPHHGSEVCTSTFWCSPGTHRVDQASSASSVPSHKSNLAYAFSIASITYWLLESKGGLLFFHLLLKLSKTKLCL